METTVLKVGGMTCGGCVKSVANVLQKMPGVKRAEVSLEKGEASVEYDSKVATRDALAQAIIDAGFEAS